MERISSKNSFGSTLTSEESITKENLNNALLILSDERILPKASDEIFYNIDEPHSSSRNIETDDRLLSDLFEHTNSTSLFSLSYTRTKLNKNHEYFNDSMQNSNNLQYQHDTNVEKNNETNIEEQNHETNKYVPLNIVLRRMFDEILGKYSNLTEDSNTTDSKSLNECSLNNNKLLLNKLDSTHEICNHDTLYNVQNPKNIVVTSIKNVNNSNVLSSHDTSVSCLDFKLRQKLSTILENSNEENLNVSNSEIHNSFDSSESYVDKLPKLPVENIMGKYYINRKIFNTTDMSDTETSISSSISSEIEIVNAEIFRKRNSLQSNDLNSVSQNSLRKIYDINNVNSGDCNVLSNKQSEVL